MTEYMYLFISRNLLPEWQAAFIDNTEQVTNKPVKGEKMEDFKFYK